MNIETNDLDIICPVKETGPKIVSCIHYPPLNMGFIVATHDRECINTIQTSFKENNNDYHIDKYRKYTYQHYSHIYHENHVYGILLLCLFFDH